MWKFGYEIEAFMVSRETNVPVVIPQSGWMYNHVDSCGYLLEFRSQPFQCPLEAAFNLMYDINKCEIPEGYMAMYKPVMSVPRSVRLAASRTYEKGLTSYQNLYGFQAHRNSQSEGVAGIHVSVTNLKTAWVGSGKHQESFSWNDMWDYPQFIRFMDDRFKQEIKESKRNPGFYELKHDGRFEYRSLPNSVNIIEVAKAIKEYFNIL